MIFKVKPLQPIILGKQGEQRAITVEFHITDYIRQFGDGGTFSVLNRRPGEADAYPVTVTRDGDSLLWNVNEADNAYDGHGKCELQYTIDGVIAKSESWETIVIKSLGAGSAVPSWEQEWQDRLTAISGEVTRKADEVYEAYESGELKGDTGPRGPAGIQGPTGPTGPTGPAGPKGDLENYKVVNMLDLLTAAGVSTIDSQNRHITADISDVLQTAVNDTSIDVIYFPVWGYLLKKEVVISRNNLTLMGEGGSTSDLQNTIRMVPGTGENRGRIVCEKSGTARIFDIKFIDLNFSSSRAYDEGLIYMHRATYFKFVRVGMVGGATKLILNDCQDFFFDTCSFCQCGMPNGGTDGPVNPVNCLRYSEIEFYTDTDNPTNMITFTNCRWESFRGRALYFRKSRYVRPDGTMNESVGVNMIRFINPKFESEHSQVQQIEIECGAKYFDIFGGYITTTPNFIPQTENMIGKSFTDHFGTTVTLTEENIGDYYQPCSFFLHTNSEITNFNTRSLIIPERTDQDSRFECEWQTGSDGFLVWNNDGHGRPIAKTNEDGSTKYIYDDDGNKVPLKCHHDVFWFKKHGIVNKPAALRDCHIGIWCSEEQLARYGTGNGLIKCDTAYNIHRTCMWRNGNELDIVPKKALRLVTADVFPNGIPASTDGAWEEDDYIISSDESVCEGYLYTNGNWVKVGAVRDVKVNGTSVVNNGVASISLSGKQDKLIAGENIVISGATINAVDTIYDDSAIRDRLTDAENDIAENSRRDAALWDIDEGQTYKRTEQTENGLNVAPTGASYLTAKEIFGKSTQDGTPSPSSPVEIVSVVNPVVKVMGKNLFDPSVFVDVLGGTLGSDGYYTVRSQLATIWNNDLALTGSLHLMYDIYDATTQRQVLFRIVYTDGTVVSVYPWGQGNETQFITNADKTVEYISASYSTQGNYKIRNVYVGTTTTAYEPYTEPVTYTINGTFRSAGTAHDSIVIGRDKLTKITRIGTVDLGTLNWSILGSTNDTARFQSTAIASLKPVASNNIAGNLICDCYTNATRNNVYYRSADYIIAVTTDSKLNVWDRNYITSLTECDITGFKTAVTGKYAFFEMATPTSSELTFDGTGLEMIPTDKHISVVDADGRDVPWLAEYIVKGLPIATNTELGVVKAKTSYGLDVNSSGELLIQGAYDSDVTARRTDIRRPLMPSSIDIATKTALTTGTMTYTDSEKASACERIGAVRDNWHIIGQVTTTTAQSVIEINANVGDEPKEWHLSVNIPQATTAGGVDFSVQPIGGSTTWIRRVGTMISATGQSNAVFGFINGMPVSPVSLSSPATFGVMPNSVSDHFNVMKNGCKKFILGTYVSGVTFPAGTKVTVIGR